MSTNLPQMTQIEILFPELSYKIMGILFEVHNKLGTKYQEKHYQRAIETKLIENGIPYEKEFQIKVDFENRELGEFYIDFLIDHKIILEVKKIWQITQNDVKQVLRYLDVTGLRLAIIANFRHERLEYRRVLN